MQLRIVYVEQKKNELGISESYFSKSDFKLSDYTWDKPFGKWKYTEPSGMQMIREDFHKPQNISDTYHPSNMNSHPHGDIPMTTVGHSIHQYRGLKYTNIGWSMDLLLMMSQWKVEVTIHLKIV